MDSKVLIYLVIIGLVLFLFFKWYNKFKFPKTNCISLITGGVKSGKTTFAVGLARSTYKKELRSWKIRNFFSKLIKHKEIEKPCLYSNIPLTIPYVPINQSLLMRKTRPTYRSVFLINEASLLADSQLFKDKTINERLMFFNKLFGHETLGGHIVYDTQSIQDLHYSIKRCLSEYFYIHHLEKRIPFFLYALVREERYSDDGTIVNSYNEDLEESLKKVLIPKKVWKIFDAYCYSALTDDKPVYNKEIQATNLKCKNIVSFRNWETLNDE